MGAPSTRLLCAFCTGCILAIAPLASHASVVCWGSAIKISDDTDVSTAGDLVGAYNLGATGVPQAIVNGVTFLPFAITGTNLTVGNFTYQQISSSFTTNTGFGSGNGSFNGLSSP